MRIFRSKNAHDSQTGFTLIEVLAAAGVLSILILGIGTFWIKADGQANQLVTRQKAIFVANGEMERIVALYKFTGFGFLGALTTSGYNDSGPASFPTTRLTYNVTLFPSMNSGADYTTTSSTTFQTGNGAPFLVWETAQITPSTNRSYVWIDPKQNVMGRLSWILTAISPSQCLVGSGSCYCLAFLGTGSGFCQRLDLYLEYPYRLVSGVAVAGSPIQTVTLSTIVGRST